MRHQTPSSVVCASVTLVRQPSEESLLRGSLAALASHGMRMYVADGGSGADFQQFLAGLPGVTAVEPDGRGLVPQVKAAMGAAYAAGAEFVLYTESDKQVFFAEHLDAFIDAAMASPSNGVVLAARSESSYATFPPLQRYAEGVINQLTGDFVGVAGDYSYGPFLVHRELLPNVQHAADDLGWGWRHFLFAQAQRSARPVRLVRGDYACPEDQRAEDGSERVHRLKQLAQNVNGLLAGLTAPPGGRS